MAACTKHEREIALEPWHEGIVDAHPRERVGVEWKSLDQSRAAVTVSVARKASVALLDAHVGPTY